MGLLDDWGVSDLDADWIPPLLDLWIHCFCELIVFINFDQSGVADFFDSRLELSQKYNFEVAEITFKKLFIRRRRSTIKLDIIVR